MGISRNRSRVEVDNSITLKSGATSLQNFQWTVYPHPQDPNRAYYATSVAKLPTRILFDKVEVPLTGCPTSSTTISGTLYYFYTTAGITARVNSYAAQITSGYEPDVISSLNNLYPTSTSGILLNYGDRTMNDVVVKNFKKLSSLGQVFFNPSSSLAKSMSSSFDFHYSTPLSLSGAFLSYGKTSGSFAWEGTLRVTFQVQASATNRVAFGVPTNVANTFIGNAAFAHSHIDGASAINHAFAQVSDAELDLPLILLEGKKTVSHLTLTALKLFKFVKTIKKKALSEAIKKNPWLQLKDISTSSKEFAKLWLEYRYAWRPLVMDAVSAYNYMVKPERLIPRRTFRGFKTDQSDLEIDTTISSGSYTYRFRGTTATTRSVRAGVLTEIDIGVSEFRNLGGFNVFGTAWELIPWSFVVDWFIDVKGVVSTLNPSPGIKTLGSWAQYISEKRFSGIVDITHVPSGVMKSVNFSHSSVSKQRDVGVGSTYINLDVSLDVFKLVDAVSLLRQLKH